MRDVNQWIDAVTDEKTKAALRRLMAATLASQALAAAAVRGERLGADEVRGWIEAVAGYPGVTMTKIEDDGPGRTVGEIAEEIAKYALGVRPS